MTHPIWRKYPDRGDIRSLISFEPARRSISIHKIQQFICFTAELHLQCGFTVVRVKTAVHGETSALRNDRERNQVTHAKRLATALAVTCEDW
jgi:hypothetical protein